MVRHSLDGKHNLHVWEKVYLMGSGFSRKFCPNAQDYTIGGSGRELGPIRYCAVGPGPSPDRVLHHAGEWAASHKWSHKEIL